MEKEYHICVIGLGYVGLPLTIELSKHFKTVGFDINERRIEELNNGIDVTKEVEPKDLVHNSNLIFTEDIEKIKRCNVFIVTVPTPIDRYNNPDLGPIKNACNLVSRVLKKEDLVIFESTVYPGCTVEYCAPIIETNSNLKFNQDFFLGYSPERIVPGDKVNTLTNIVKVVSGSTPKAALEIQKIYNQIIKAGTHLATSIEVAEASKAIENAQRDLNISFMNELSLFFDKIGLDTNEVIEAAATKWNFLKYKPGLVGGHCISVDPYYLLHRAKEVNFFPDVIASGRRVNDQMPEFVAAKTIRLLHKKGFDLKNSRVLIMGVTFKENCPDIRNSKVYEVYKHLLDYGISNIDVHDPWADPEEVMREFQIKIHKAFNLNNYEAIILAVPHEEYGKLDFSNKINQVIFDLKGFLPKHLVDARL